MQNLSAEEALHIIGESEKLASVAPFWEESQKHFPLGGPEFLLPNVILENRAWCGFNEEADELLLRAAKKICGEPALARLAWHCAWCLYDCDEPATFENWPDFRSILGDDFGLLYLLVAISMVPRVRIYHKTLGIPEAVTLETCREPFAFNLNHLQMTEGRMGIYRTHLFWLRNYTREPYFRLGRLEFWLKKFEEGIKVFRNRESGMIIALAADGERFDEHGFMPAETEAKQPGEWISAMVESQGKITGNPILPSGQVRSTQVEIDLELWDCVLQPGSWVLDMHIPAGGKMTPEACKDSMERAKVFFETYFPTTPPQAIVCWSWIYSPVLDQILPEESNLVKNMKEAYLFPYPSDENDGLGFIFYQEQIDLTSAPRNTWVQRAFLDYLNQGKRWRCGAMFFLTDHIKNYGAQQYRRQDFAFDQRKR